MNEKLCKSVSHLPLIRSQLSSKGILITGCSGFLGKVKGVQGETYLTTVVVQALLEKILRCCPEVDRVFVLLRSHTKNGMDAQRRLHEEIFPSSCFDKLRRIRPESLQKCRAIQGDVCLPKFGISEAEYMSVREDVNVVFHCAATINFNENLKTAFKINVDSVIHLVDICKR
eukprot:746762-Hanusia_phi.AAC.4